MSSVLETNHKSPRRPKINIDALDHGSFITIDEIENVSQMNRSDRRFPFMMVGIQQDIMADTIRNGRCMIAKIEGGKGIRILTNDEASEHGPEMADRLLDRHHIWLLRTRSAVKDSDLSEEQKRRYNSRMNFHARVQQQIEVARREKISAGENEAKSE